MKGQKFTLSPFGSGEITEILHQGKSFDIYRVNLCQEDVVIKTISPNFTGNNLYSSGADLGSEYFIYSQHGIENIHNTIGSSKNINTLEIATAILLTESQIINWTGGAWNHRIIGLGTWDGLANGLLSEVSWRFLPVLIMPYYPAVSFASLSPSTKRYLFPKMLPALWDALSVMHHGDLSENNILISQTQNIFHLIDPGVFLSSKIKCNDSWWVESERAIFTTTAANYPLFYPFLPLNQVKDNSLIKSLKRLEASREYINFNLSCRQPEKSLDKVQKKSAPSLPDLLALGIIYYRILTQQELFLGRKILPDKPAWEYSYMTPRFINIYETINYFLEDNYLENELNKAKISQEERNLVYQLVNLKIRTREDLLKLLIF